MKKSGRKLRKQKRKNKQKNTKSWITPELEKKLRSLARRLTKEAPRNTALYNKKSYCKKCQKLFCLGFDNTETYCRDCYAENYCSKEIQLIRYCKNC